ncbi:lck-interacting transmembrane adapter 1 isoform X1 [Dasypus novemcinctus]|uniref:lck-interacting transmembrane adapter 1 isoform X1 n=1 Tax=Dasypus novemcinctus TaxID=9361 RepID=UPI000329245C|nr:lck-interacting transmembrane adapter 1 isoform X1 [Dasypus novemcinctus]
MGRGASLGAGSEAGAPPVACFLRPRPREDCGAAVRAWARLGVSRMSPQVPSATPALWVLGSFALLLWLWALCAACHRYVHPVQGQPPRAGASAGGSSGKLVPQHTLLYQALGQRLTPPHCPAGPSPPRRQAGLQGSVRSAEAMRVRLSPGARCPPSLPSRTHLCALSKSDTRLHELHRGPRSSRAPRPASMDLLYPHWPERPPAAPATSPSGLLPAAVPPAGPQGPYSSVELAALPRASLAAGPVVWAGARLASSCARPRPETGPAVPEYACIRKPRETSRGSQSLQQGSEAGTPASQVDVLYSRVSKPRRDPGAATVQQGPTGKRAVLALASGGTPETLPGRGPLENVYESIQELTAPGRPEPSSAGS